MTLIGFVIKNLSYNWSITTYWNSNENSTVLYSRIKLVNKKQINSIVAFFFFFLNFQCPSYPFLLWYISIFIDATWPQLMVSIWDLWWISLPSWVADHSKVKCQPRSFDASLERTRNYGLQYLIHSSRWYCWSLGAAESYGRLLHKYPLAALSSMHY